MNSSVFYLWFDGRDGRWTLHNYGLHCGDGFEAMIEGSWVSTRIEHSSASKHSRGWYLATHPNQPLDNLPVRKASPRPAATAAMSIKQLTPPPGLLEALEALGSKLEYTTPKTLFHGIWIGGDLYCGVFGDGENGAYEWFEYAIEKNEVRHSNKGFGSTSFALAEILAQHKDLL